MTLERARHGSQDDNAYATEAFSPGINDSATVIDAIGVLVRLLVRWGTPSASQEIQAPTYDRVEVPRIQVGDLFEDAFTAISRDGAGLVEVVLCLQKALHAFASVDDEAIGDTATHHARLVLARAEMVLKLEDDLAAVRAAADAPNASKSI